MMKMNVSIYKLATPKGISSYSITAKRTVLQRWSQITLYSSQDKESNDKEDSKIKQYICSAYNNRC